MINISVDNCHFLKRLKEVQVVHLFKKKDPLTKSNHRSVSILPIPSKKNLKRYCLSNCLSILINKIYMFLCVFRKGHGCQTTLLRLLEDWKKALDNNEYLAAIIMDLSKAFDCLPHDILLSKLSAYGLTENSIKLLYSYLSDRKQQIKIGNIISRWEKVQKGVHQGSILDPYFLKFLFMIFLILFINLICIIMLTTIRYHFTPLIMKRIYLYYRKKVTF